MPTGCREGLVLAADGVSCVGCPNDWTVQGDGCVPKETCAQGQVLAGDGATCVPCPADWTESGGGCVPTGCREGLVLAADGVSCVGCPNDWTVQGDGCVPKETCAQGQVLAGDGVTCVPCPAGWYYYYKTTSTGACGPCPVGSYSSRGGTCELCAPGFFSGQAGASECTACAAQQYAPTSGLSGCLDCNEWVMKGGTECTVPSCAEAHYYDESRGECQPCSVCQASTYTVRRCGGLNDTVCAGCLGACPSFYALTEYCTLYEDSVCSYIGVCAAGTYFVGYSCAPCADGQYNAEPGATACTACAGGYYPNAAKTGCVGACEAGSYLTAGLFCAYCGPGTGSCRPCPANTYAALRGQSACIPCPNGTWAATGSSACSSSTCLR